MIQTVKHQIKKGNPEWMGAVACAKGVNFTVDIAGAKEVSLLIYEKKITLGQMPPAYAFAIHICVSIIPFSGASSAFSTLNEVTKCDNI